MKYWSLILSFTLLFPVLGMADSTTIEHWQDEGWKKTKFSKIKVAPDEIISGGVSRDGIPPIYDPQFESVTSAQKWLPDSEPVLVFANAQVAKAYPLRILIWHEIVNDQFQGKSFIATYCPLCNSAFIFNTHLDGQNHEFGVSGKLHNSDLVMWDHQTESWWQQLTGQAIVGEYAGRRLEMLASPTVSFGTFGQTYPDGLVLSQETGHRRDYGGNPYQGYESASVPFLMKGEIDSRLPAMSRVVGILWRGRQYTLPLTELETRRFAEVSLDNGHLVLLNLDQSNAMLEDAKIVRSNLINTVTVWESEEGVLGLKLQDGKVVDEQGREWNALGQGFKGGSQVAQLKPVNFGLPFAFAWLAFYPDADFISLK